MTQRGILISLIVALALFCGSAYVGYRSHERSGVIEQLSQPGWCCENGRVSCVISQGSAQCRKNGGGVFNWDQTTCNALCEQTSARNRKQPAVRKSIKSAAGNDVSTQQQ